MRPARADGALQQAGGPLRGGIGERDEGERLQAAPLQREHERKRDKDGAP